MVRARVYKHPIAKHIKQILVDITIQFRAQQVRTQIGNFCYEWKTTWGSDPAIPWVPPKTFAQGQALGMRLAPNFESEMDDDEPILNAFLFDDGGMRGVAAALVWCGLIYFCGSLPADKVCDPQVVSLARSLLTIPTYYRQDEPDPTRAMIGRIIRQNVEAKKLAVSSFEWSQILAGMAKDGEKITVSQAVEIYNASPEVVAHGIGSGSKDTRANKTNQNNIKIIPLSPTRFPIQCLKDLLLKTSMEPA